MSSKQGNSVKFKEGTKGGDGGEEAFSKSLNLSQRQIIDSLKGSEVRNYGYKDTDFDQIVFRHRVAQHCEQACMEMQLGPETLSVRENVYTYLQSCLDDLLRSIIQGVTMNSMIRLQYSDLAFGSNFNLHATGEMINGKISLSQALNQRKLDEKDAWTKKQDELRQEEAAKAAEEEITKQIQDRVKEGGHMTLSEFGLTRSHRKKGDGDKPATKKVADSRFQKDLLGFLGGNKRQSKPGSRPSGEGSSTLGKPGPKSSLLGKSVGASGARSSAISSRKKLDDKLVLSILDLLPFMESAVFRRRPSCLHAFELVNFADKALADQYFDKKNEERGKQDILARQRINTFKFEHEMQSLVLDNEPLEVLQEKARMLAESKKYQNFDSHKVESWLSKIKSAIQDREIGDAEHQKGEAADISESAPASSSTTSKKSSKPLSDKKKKKKHKVKKGDDYEDDPDADRIDESLVMSMVEGKSKSKGVAKKKSGATTAKSTISKPKAASSGTGKKSTSTPKVKKTPEAGSKRKRDEGESDSDEDVPLGQLVKSKAESDQGKSMTPKKALARKKVASKKSTPADSDGQPPAKKAKTESAGNPPKTSSKKKSVKLEEGNNGTDAVSKKAPTSKAATSDVKNAGKRKVKNPSKPSRKEKEAKKHAEYYENMKKGWCICISVVNVKDAESLRELFKPEIDRVEGNYEHFKSKFGTKTGSNSSDSIQAGEGAKDVSAGAAAPVAQSASSNSSGTLFSSEQSNGNPANQNSKGVTSSYVDPDTLDSEALTRWKDLIPINTAMARICASLKFLISDGKTDDCDLDDAMMQVCKDLLEQATKRYKSFLAEFPECKDTQHAVERPAKKDLEAARAKIAEEDAAEAQAKAEREEKQKAAQLARQKRLQEKEQAKAKSSAADNGIETVSSPAVVDEAAPLSLASLDVGFASTTNAADGGLPAAEITNSDAMEGDNEGMSTAGAGVVDGDF